MIAIGIIVLILMRKFNAKRSQQIFMYFWIGFGVLWTTLAFISTGSEYFSSIRAMKNGTYKEVEGIVENFDPMPHSGHKNESFTVNGVKFEYSDFGPSSGFNNTKSHGGPIDEGKYVRINYYDGKILQLWVKE
ncbi:hypothetical protein [Ulvibacter litoralis]|uniref:hypothetical protein n=1 Tax=Ulvibacter litoralis TaxID=227084 RepID=UPI0016744663|nr:hypothetical protein [Ulvibacter litoralis]GHC66836.1 hypothetical protein GCM10008083_34290 [Ulvibacter litoralis]